MIIYLNNQPIGKIETTEDGREFSYISSYLHQPNAVAISLSLPLDPAPYPEKMAKPFFDSISPDLWDSDAEHHFPCAGSLSFYKYNPSIQPYNEIEIAECEELLNRQLVPIPNNRLIAIADVQPHLGISIIDGEIFQAVEPNNNTHILKSDLPEFEDLVGNEIFVSLIAYNLNIAVPMISRVHLNNTPALVMDRPDRFAPASAAQLGQKIHHESFISALSNQIFGSGKKHHISMDGQFDLLRQYAIVPAVDCRSLIRAISLCLIAGCDDFAIDNQLIEILPNTSCRLAPFSGFITTDLYPNTAKRFLDYLFGIQHFAHLKKSHICDFAQKIRVNDKYLCSVILELSHSIPKIAKDIFETFPALKSPITLKIAKLIDQRSIILRAMLQDKKLAKEKVLQAS